MKWIVFMAAVPAFVRGPDCWEIFESKEKAKNFILSGGNSCSSETARMFKSEELKISFKKEKVRSEYERIVGIEAGDQP